MEVKFLILNTNPLLLSIQWSDIVGATTDGASVMVKLGRLLPCQHNICLAHTLHLVIGDVFYSKTNTTDQTTLHFAETELTEVSSDLDSDEEEDEDESMPTFTSSQLLSTPNLNSTIAPLIHKVRKAVKFFRRSPVKMDSLRSLLQKHPEVTVSSLILDCKTRWSTMAAMLERYLLLATPITSLLKEFNKTDLVLSTRELDILRATSASLEAFKWASEQTCSNSLDLATADCMIRFLELKLEQLLNPTKSTVL